MVDGFLAQEEWLLMWRAQASRAFGALRKAVYLDKHLKLTTKRKIHNACVLSGLLYGAECWVFHRKQE